ncbi:cell division protein FtsX [Tsukamurella pulmonis]|uniref:Cell division protein FtsX n=1 Tax=Tsukamurella pulmonis TaxID=47312 RepID=A0A1H1GNP4_9ACTN|nr:permease-like cell division protein FtsX [Tsukamurella pulmonis]KXO88340.1 cell division protein FtsX [Tsukamurella pulmonis]KXP13317.1 cell division protein FtsX [Tsukamurella pulmonis]RDH13297.1 ABC transporter permease [Tsukamurella pulmonis]SDR14844.1 cell division protein FtsX [Tsukamurella pulmonis]SUP16945.1 Cell division protein FtsX [Tsukamurella pulmonis]
MRASFITSEVLTGLRRNVSMTIAMILTTAISLGLFGGGLLVVRMADKSQDIFLQRVEIQVFVDDKVAADDPDCQKSVCQAIESKIKAQPGVDSIDYISQDKALETAKTKTFAGQPELAELVRPGVLPASFKVRVGDEQKFSAVIDAVQGQPGVAGVQDQRELVERVFSVLGGARNAAFFVALIQAVAAVLLIANMVQVAAYTRRTEVSIMRLVGASRWYTQLPFLLEAVIGAVIGAVLAIAGLFAGKSLFFDRALRELYGVNILARITNTDVLLVSPWLVLVGAGFAAITAYVTLRFYVRE